MKTSGTCYIQKTKYEYTIKEDGIRMKNNKDDKFIEYFDIFSIRKIKLYKVEIFLYIVLSLIGFTFWWLLGVFLSAYTFLQYWANKRIILITHKGQITLSFDNSFNKESFAKALYAANPSSFKIIKWFKFRRDEK